MALSTIEVRWFFEGPLADHAADVERWFRSSAQNGERGALAKWEPAPPAWREDRYLLVPGADDLGVKWREGRLEIKGRIADLGTCVFARGIEGRCERWIKWGYAGDLVSARCFGLFQGRAEATGVVLVAKRRLQRLFRLGARGETAAVAFGEPRECGVNLELARIRVGRRSEAHWSLAFEAFPGEEAMEPFALAVGRLLKRCPAPLTAARSMGYPSWLLRIERSGQAARSGGRADPSSA